VIADLKELGLPDAVFLEIVVAKFQLKPDQSACQQLLDRLQTHIDSLPKGSRNRPKSLYMQIVMEHYEIVPEAARKLAKKVAVHDMIYHFSAEKITFLQ
jgi:hypothetical protein